MPKQTVSRRRLKGSKWYSHYGKLPGHDPGSVRAKSRLNQLSSKISNVKSKLKNINKRLSTSYPANFAAIENKEEKLRNQLRIMTNKKVQIMRAQNNKAKGTNSGYKFGHPSKTMSVNRHIVNAKIGFGKTFRRSPNRRTTKLGEPIGSVPTVVFLPGEKRYGLPSSFAFKYSRKVSTKPVLY